MKKFILAALITSILLPCTASEIPFIKEDWEKARTMAADQDKMLLVDFYTDWCSWCRVMDTTTFRDSAVAAYVNQHFIPLSIDAERGFGITVAMKYRVNAYPSYAYFTPDGRMLTKSVGYQPPEDYLNTLREVAARNDSGLVCEGVTRETNLDFPDFFSLALGPKKTRKNPEQSVVDAYLDGEKDYFAEVPFSVICRFTTKDEVSDFVIENRDKLEKLYGPPDVAMKISSIISGRLRTAIREKDTTLLNNVLALSDRYEQGGSEENHERYRMRYYSGTKEWSKYAEMVTAGIESGRTGDAGINSAVWTIYENCDDMTVVKNAVAWMAKIIDDGSSYAYLDTYAAILHKDGQNQKAEEYALKAIAKGKSDQENVSETEELLTKIRGRIQ